MRRISGRYRKEEMFKKFLVGKPEEKV